MTEPQKEKRSLEQHDISGRIKSGQTITEYLVGKGLEKGIDLVGGRRYDESTILRVTGGSKYQLGPVIAEGGMGVIYEATDLNSRRTVALKVLPQELPDPEDDLLRFIREGQLTSQLEHPNIVPVHEVGLDEEGRVFYTMKYVQGRTLTSILIDIRDNDPATVQEYPLARLLNIFQKVCDAVAFAHSKNVLHRDLKPDNIMVGSYGEVLVMDWGLAKIFDQLDEVTWPKNETRMVEDPAESEDLGSMSTDDFGSALKTISGRVMGTPGFMAPEQVFASEMGLDERADVYSLGAILYSLLTMRPTVSGSEIADVLRKIVIGDFTPPADFNEEVVDATRPGETRAGSMRQGPFAHCPDGWIPSALSDVAMRALATEADERYSSVQEFQRAVEDYQNGYVWHVVIDEDFSNSDILSRWEILGGQAEVKNGELRLHDGEPQVMILKRDVPGDVRIEFECRQESAYLNCLSCFMNAMRSPNHREIPWNGYEFEYGGYDNSRNVLHRANEQVWIEPDAPLAKGETCHMLAERIGSQLRLEVNGREIVSWIDSDPLSGTDRVAVGFVGWLADTRYTRIKVSTLGTPWKGDVLDVAERQIQKGRYDVAIGLFEDTLESFPDADRRSRAEFGLALARQRHELSKRLPGWNGTLKEAWPDLDIELQMVNDGLCLDISNKAVADLSPLRDMPLNMLYCAHCGVSDLSPLRGMPLTALNCTGNPIADLAPLRGMPLKALLCEDCPISNLQPLVGMPLKMFQMGKNSVVSLEPLTGMPLSFLSCWSCAIESLDPLRGMGLDNLNCAGNRIETLEPLRGMSLTNLHCGGNQIEDLSPLHDMPLTVLHCGDNQITSLLPLSGLPLTILSCQANQITDLEPLRGMPLGAVACGDNPLKTLGPLAAHPPEDFLYYCDSLSDMVLENLKISWLNRPEQAQHVRDLDVLLAMRAGDVARMKKLATQFDGRKYLFVPKSVRWEEAKELCEAWGGNLLTVKSRAVDDFIATMFGGGCWFWMGLSTTDGRSEWVTGEPVEYRNFVGEMQEQVVGPKVFSRLWRNDHVQDPHNCFMIEWAEDT